MRKNSVKRNHAQKISSNQLFSNLTSSVKTLIWLDGKKCPFFTKNGDSVYSKYFSTMHTVEISEIYSHWKILRQITYLVMSLVKLLLSRNFCQKCVRVNSRDFHTVQCALQKEFPSNQLFSNCFHGSFAILMTFQ